MGSYPADQIVDQYTLDDLKSKGIDVSSIESTLQRQKSTPTTSSSSSFGSEWESAFEGL